MNIVTGPNSYIGFEYPASGRRQVQQPLIVPACKNEHFFIFYIPDAGGRHFIAGLILISQDQAELYEISFAFIRLLPWRGPAHKIGPHREIVNRCGQPDIEAPVGIYGQEVELCIVPVKGEAASPSNSEAVKGFPDSAQYLFLFQVEKHLFLFV